MDKWGEINLHKIEEPRYFWGLFDELLDDQSEFIFNKDTILEAYKNGNMYGLMVEETDEMYKNLENEDLFCHDMSGERQGYLLPCFCIKLYIASLIKYCNLNSLTTLQYK